MKKKTCLFCNQAIAGRKSNEHIFPQWLLDHFGIRKTKVTPTHRSFIDYVIKSIRKHTLNKFLAGKICQECNNGWMSELENSAKENIINLAENKKAVTDLKPEERFILARWTIKTALVLNSGSNFLKNVPKEHYHYIFKQKDKIPKNVAVFAQQHMYTEKFFWIQGSQWTVTGKNASLDKELEIIVLTKSYKIALQFGHLMLLVAHNPIDKYLFSFWKGIHVPLYPLKGKVTWFERSKDDFPWKDSIKATSLFHFSLGLCDPCVTINYKNES